MTFRRISPVAASLAMPLLVVLALGLAMVLRVRQAQASLVFDEYASLFFADRPFRDLWGWWLVRETNPPLFYSLLKLWRMVVGDDGVALRAMPIAISLGQIGLAGWFARRTWGWPAALACVVLLALSPSDIYQSAYLRGYGLAKLAVTGSFLGLVAGLRGEARGWAVYAAGAVVAVYCHTTMLLWPVVASGAALAVAWDVTGRGLPWRRLLVANAAVLVVSGWELALVWAQMHARTGNISWIKPLDAEDFFATVKLQVLQGGDWGSALMLVLLGAGLARGWPRLETRLAAAVLALGLALFKAADLAHPVVTDFTLHWLGTFAAWLAGAAFCGLEWRALLGAAGIAAVGLWERQADDAIPHPQDWTYVVETVARAPGSALLVSHESIGVIVQEACRVRFGSECPFRLVVMRNGSTSDSWAFGGYRGRVVSPDEVRGALSGAKVVYAFSRYVYTPLAPLGLDPGDYREVEWDDGELIGPIPLADFGQRLPGK